MEPLLSLRDLSKYYRRNGREIRAVDGVNLDVFPGEAVGLIGESGCGKSTLARCAMRLLRPTSGTVHFDGEDLAGLSASKLRLKRREFQMIFQDAFLSLDPRMSVARTLREPFAAHGIGTRAERDRSVDELLEAVALDRSVLNRHPAEISGGQQQRVAIARALALKPRLIVADEPVSALDASVQAQILNLLAVIRKRYGLTLVLISHSLPVVRYLCDRVAVMYLGRLVEENSTEDFFRAPLHPYGELLIESMPVMDPAGRTRSEVRGDIPSILDPPPGCAFHPRCARALPGCATGIPRLSQVKSNAKAACLLYT
jgi:peptide/nickel transport system ATP-binding protein/oligopeptide transport system ATP-binding protein